jgi:RimJ/RimL family protein N-acetyltransferase
MLRKENVVLRAIRKSDLENFLRWYNDPDILENITLYLPMNEIAEAQWIEDVCTKRSSTDIVFVIEVEKDEKVIPIGNCGLHRINLINRDAEAGMVIGEKNFQNSGYGTIAGQLLLGYAFNILNLHRISAGAFGFNERSIAVQKKNGAIEEGRIREAIYKNGRYWDKILLGILRSDWEKLNKK